MLGSLAASILPLVAATASSIEFNRDIRPILSERCYLCHGPDRANRKTPLRFDTEEGAFTPLAGARPAIARGEPAASEMYRRITSADPATRMPPAYLGHARLSDREIELIQRWIEQGARWQKHWAFLAPQRAELPAVRNRAWPRNAIDYFVLERLEREGLGPSAETDRATLIRRVSLDLTGLPPSPPEVDAFLNDASPEAYEKVVDRLLRSPRYGERMAVAWLDAARYADTNGYQTDGVRSMWRWRDWVIDAFNRNLTFDRFTIEQIAGDLLPNATREQKIATAFHRNHRTSAEGGIVEEEFRVEYVADRVETTATVWLGLTAGCARCHDHKYDPITQKEFYQLFAFFNNVPERGLVYNFGNEEPMLAAPTPEEEARLAELDRKLVAAERQYAGLSKELARAQRRWEKTLKRLPAPDWTVRDGLVFHDGLDEEPGSAEGKVGRAASFDGKRVIEKGEVARFNYLDPFTLAAWIRPSAPNGAILSREEDHPEGEGYGLYLKNGRIWLHITRRWTDISLRLETDQALELNRWHHVAVTYDGKRKGAGVRVYVNGEAQKIRVLFDELGYPFGAKEPFRIGGGGGVGNRFQGAIDEVRAYNRALAAEEVAVLPLGETVSAIATRSPQKRTPAQASKLALAFLDQHAPPYIRRARAELERARRGRAEFADKIPTVMVMKENVTSRPAHVLERGAYDAPREAVTAAAPAILPPLPAEAPKNRLGLARWLVDPANPLTARVTVNRLWEMLFGTGLVKTVEDFGAQGEWPSHPELLDWLATQFVGGGWDVRAILKTMVMSATYRQASRVGAELLEKDPENRLLGRGPRFRLPAEMIRDQALALAGLLVEKIGGPSVKPYQPPRLWEELSGVAYKPDLGEGLYRRSLYTYWKRTIAPPSMITFDAANRETCSVRRVRTNTPLQALNLMNELTYVEASRKLAERMLREGGDTAESRIGWAFRHATARRPRAEETAVLTAALRRFEESYDIDGEYALKLLGQGESPRDPGIEPRRLAAYAALASLILNLDETITKE